MTPDRPAEPEGCGMFNANAAVAGTYPCRRPRGHDGPHHYNPPADERATVPEPTAEDLAVSLPALYRAAEYAHRPFHEMWTNDRKEVQGVIRRLAAAEAEVARLRDLRLAFLSEKEVAGLRARAEAAEALLRDYKNRCTCDNSCSLCARAAAHLASQEPK